jgi:very-short-patch-repair endonuclease
LADKRLTPVARKLRADPTEAQKRLWWHLRGRQLGVQFTRESGIGNGRLRLAIELDGGQHSDSPTDEARTKLIETHGYRVIRFWNHDVLQNTDGVLQALVAEIELARNRF